MQDEGYTKFQATWIPGEPLSPVVLRDLIPIRQRLYQQQLIGQYPSGVGYGNLSIRAADGHSLIISGTATGGLAQLTAAHFCRVTEVNLAENSLTCVGPIQASSESMTHAALYRLDEAIQAVIHVHHAVLWKALLHTVPTTAADVAYGTPAMAREMRRLYRDSNLPDQKILAMAGHEEGLLTFGHSLAAAYQTLMHFTRCLMPPYTISG